MDPKRKLLFFDKQIESKKSLPILAFKTLTQKSSVRDLLSNPIVNLKFCDHLPGWSFQILKVEFHYHGSRTNACSIWGEWSTCPTYERSDVSNCACTLLTPFNMLWMFLFVRTCHHICVFDLHMSIFIEKKKITFWGYQIKKMAP